MTIDQAIEALKEHTARRGDRARVYRPLGTDEVWYTFMPPSGFGFEPFTLILESRQTTTMVRMDALPVKPEFYIHHFNRIQYAFEKNKGSLVINAPKIYEDDKD